ncbi:MarR family winged helix-turn-helix transcriptional regulator [Janibacter sp. GS2]|uniref:MarR family winged helix-turn-helix transcriptional regulator n=1 Tax=Janibacter sp. GS2 TaxID=3442646 RepID=UPI003EB70310
MSGLAHDLHVLVRALDRAAEGRLAPFGITYPRYLALVIVDDHPGLTQRELATALGQSEATASRTTAGLVREGHLEAERTPGAGNRRGLRLTAAGGDLVARAGDALGTSFDEVVRDIGRDPQAWATDVRRLSTILEESP